MPRIIPEPKSITASSVSYDNTTSGLAADNVQDALDEIVGLLGAGGSLISGVQRAIEDPDNLQELAEYLDIAFRPAFDTGNVATTIYVSSVGNDITGDGTSGQPYETIERAIQVIPANSLEERTISLGAGSFAIPYVISDIENIKLVGATPTTDSSHTVSSVGSSSAANGLTINVSGTPWSLGSEIGKFIQFTSGALNGGYGVVYANTANTITVTQDTVSSSFSLPTGGDAFNILSLSSTVVLSGEDYKFSRNGCNFGWEHVAFSGVTRYLDICTGSVSFTRCSFENKQVKINSGADVKLSCSYVGTTGDTSLGLISCTGNSKLEVTAGTLIDGSNAGAGAGFVSSIESNILTSGENAFLSLGSGGFTFLGSSVSLDSLTYSSADFIWRSESGNKFVRANNSRLVLPDLYGDISANYVVEGWNGSWIELGSNSSVTTGLGTTTVSADGGVTNVSIYDDYTYIEGGDPAPDGVIGNGDKLSIDFVPSQYTRNSAIPEADSDTDLAAHLKGIDDALSSAGVKTYTFSRSFVTVPPTGTLYLAIGDVITSAAPMVVNQNGALSGGSISVDVADGSRDYELRVLVNGAVAETIALASGNTKAIDVSFSTAISASDEISVLVYLTSGVGSSTFRNIVVTLDIG